MAKFDWSKAKRVQDWNYQAAAVRRLEGALHRVGSTGAPRKASERQIEYLQILLKKAGRRPYTPDELAGLTIESASRLIKELSPA